MDALVSIIHQWLALDADFFSEACSQIIVSHIGRT